MKIITKSPTQTKNLAKKLAKSFKSGQTLGLVGDLGSGKTNFTKGLAEYFKIKQAITSPTFVLMKPYPVLSSRVTMSPEGRIGTPRGESREKITHLIHVDCYRLNNPDELLAIGLEEYLNNPNCVTVIEWAEKVRDVLPKNTIWIEFKIGKKENERTIKIK